MSQPLVDAPNPRDPLLPEEARRVEVDASAAALFRALDDRDCRTMLAVTAEEALSASELSEQCDLPRSTTYRKIELLTEAGLLEERTRLSPSGKHCSEYARRVDNVIVSLDADDRIQLACTVSE